MKKTNTVTTLTSSQYLPSPTATYSCCWWTWSSRQQRPWKGTRRRRPGRPAYRRWGFVGGGQGSKGPRIGASTWGGAAAGHPVGQSAQLVGQPARAAGDQSWPLKLLPSAAGGAAPPPRSTLGPPSPPLPPLGSLWGPGRPEAAAMATAAPSVNSVNQRSFCQRMKHLKLDTGQYLGKKAEDIYEFTASFRDT